MVAHPSGYLMTLMLNLRLETVWPAFRRNESRASWPRCQCQIADKWHKVQLWSRRPQQVYRGVCLRVKYQIAAAATMTSRITHHQSAIPPAGGAAAPPGDVPGAVVWARATEDEIARRLKPVRAADDM
jgi:hypothetical protein